MQHNTEPILPSGITEDGNEQANAPICHLRTKKIWRIRIHQHGNGTNRTTYPSTNRKLETQWSRRPANESGNRGLSSISLNRKTIFRTEPEIIPISTLKSARSMRQRTSNMATITEYHRRSTRPIEVCPDTHAIHIWYSVSVEQPNTRNTNTSEYGQNRRNVHSHNTQQ